MQSQQLVVAMENDIFNGSLPIFNHNYTILDPTMPCSFMQSGLPSNNHRRILGSNPLVSTIQETASGDMYLINNVSVPSSGISFSRNIPQIGNDSFNHSIGSSGMRQHLSGTSLSATSIANLLSSTSFPEVTMDDMRVPNVTDIHNSDHSSRHYHLGAHSDLSLHASKTDNVGHRWNQNELLEHQAPLDKMCSVVRPSYHVKRSSLPGWHFQRQCWNSTPAPGSELSLSVGSCHPSLTDTGNVADQCSEISCSAVTQVTSTDSARPPAEFQNYVHEFHLGAPQSETIASAKKPSFYPGCSNLVQLSHILLGSKYFHATQEVLLEVAAYALEDLDDSLSVIDGEAKKSFSSSCSLTEELLTLGQTEPLSTESGKFPEADRKKTELLSLLHLVR